MIKHIVMWNFKDSAEGKSKLENMEIVRDLLNSLPPLIPEIKKLETGFDVSHTSASADFCLITEFDDINALNVYIGHPEHVKVGVYVRKVIETRKSIDFEI